MRLPRTLWFVPVLLSCTLQVAFACGEDQKRSAEAAGQRPKNDRTLFVSVLLTNSGFVRDAVVLGGPTALGQAAIKAVRQRRYSNWGTTPGGQLSAARHVGRHISEAKGSAAEDSTVGGGGASGVSGCVVGGYLSVVKLPPVLLSWLTSMQPVMPVLAPDTVKVRVINGSNSQPISKQGVFVQLLYEKATNVSPPLHIETNADGEAEFSIPEPAPEHLDVRLDLTSKYRHCACWITTDTERVFSTGVLKVPASKGPNASNSHINAEPKQIVFVVRPFTLFEKLLHPLVKQ